MASLPIFIGSIGAILAILLIIFAMISGLFGGSKMQTQTETNQLTTQKIILNTTDKNSFTITLNIINSQNGTKIYLDR